MTTLPDPQQTKPIIQDTNTKLTKDTVNLPVAPTENSAGQLHKEAEPVVKTENQTLEDLMPEMEIAPELKDIGIESISETINLPPDLKKSGVETIGPSQPITQLPQVSLPISDDSVIQGKNAKIMSSFYWLYIWCVKQLKKAHLHLRKIGGKAVREKD